LRKNLASDSTGRHRSCTGILQIEDSYRSLAYEQEASMNNIQAKPGRFDADRKSELRQRITSHLAMQTPAGLPRPSWKDTLTPDQVERLVEKIRSL
jgi:hypothetical protein